jgi:hypothetical protein
MAHNYTVVRYSVGDAGLEDNRALIAGVFEELARARPDALRYLVLELEGGEFIHLVGTPDGDDASPLPRLAAFRAFTKDHADRRSSPLARSAATILGDYLMLGAPREGDSPMPSMHSRCPKPGDSRP